MITTLPTPAPVAAKITTRVSPQEPVRDFEMEQWACETITRLIAHSRDWLSDFEQQRLLVLNQLAAAERDVTSDIDNAMRHILNTWEQVAAVDIYQASLRKFQTTFSYVVVRAHRLMPEFDSEKRRLLENFYRLERSSITDPARAIQETRDEILPWLDRIEEMQEYLKQFIAESEPFARRVRQLAPQFNTEKKHWLARLDELVALAPTDAKDAQAKFDVELRPWFAKLQQNQDDLLAIFEKAATKKCASKKSARQRTQLTRAQRESFDADGVRSDLVDEEPSDYDSFREGVSKPSPTIATLANQLAEIERLFGRH